METLIPRGSLAAISDARPAPAASLVHHLPPSRSNSRVEEGTEVSWQELTASQFCAAMRQQFAYNATKSRITSSSSSSSTILMQDRAD